MDPKTDSGLIVDAEENESHLLTKLLLPEEVLWIMDQLLAREVPIPLSSYSFLPVACLYSFIVSLLRLKVSWLMGNPLAQTIFACPYITELLFHWDLNHELSDATYLSFVPQLDSFQEKLTGLVLKNFLIGVLTTTRTMLAELSQRNIYEEEDASTNLCKTNLFHGIAHEELQKLVQGALDIVEEELSTTMDDKAKPVLEAVRTRIKFRKIWVNLLADRDDGKSLEPDLRKKHYQQLIELLATFPDTMELGKPLPGAFSTKTQRMLSIEVPPRPMVVIDPKDAMPMLDTMFHQCLELEELFAYESAHEVIVSPLLAYLGLNIRISSIILQRGNLLQLHTLDHWQWFTLI